MQNVILINQRGSLTLPKELRKKYGLSKGGQLLLEEGLDGSIILRPAMTVPVEIYSDDRVAEFEQNNEEALSGFKIP